MFAKIGMGVLAAVVVFLILVATRPADFRVERSATVAAPPDIVFAQINDLRQWSRWNPFEKGDPNIKMTYGEVTSGVGASYHYTGDQMGEGRMTLTEVTPNERVAVRAEFIKPMAAVNDIEFTLRPAADGVSVTWAMSGENSFLGKAFSLFMDMDQMVGGEFEKGLADLKRVSEEEAKLRAQTAAQSEPALLTTSN